MNARDNQLKQDWNVKECGDLTWGEHWGEKGCMLCQACSSTRSTLGCCSPLVSTASRGCPACMRTSLQSCMTCMHMVTGVCIALHAASAANLRGPTGEHEEQCFSISLALVWVTEDSLQDCAQEGSMLSIVNWMRQAASAHFDSHLDLCIIAAGPVIA